jgi:hypothetical protein
VDDIGDILDGQSSLLGQAAADLRQPGLEPDAGVQAMLRSLREAAATLQALPAALQQPAGPTRETQRVLETGNREASATRFVPATGAHLDSAAPQSAAPGMDELAATPAPAAPRIGLEEIAALLAQLNHLGAELLQAAWSIHNKVTPGGAS